MPRQKLIANILMYATMALFLYLLYVYLYPMFFGGNTWGFGEWLALANLVVLYIGAFEIMVHTQITNWKVLIGLLVAPLVLMVLWVISMMQMDTYFAYVDGVGKTNPLGAIGLVLVGWLGFFWPSIICGLLSRGLRGL